MVKHKLWIQVFVAVFNSVNSLLPPFYLVNETSGEGLSGCYESKTVKNPTYEKIEEPKMFLMYDNCWIFSSDSDGLGVKYRLR